MKNRIMDNEQIIDKLFREKPMELYDLFLMEYLTPVYTEWKKTATEDWRKYAFLLVDKFAIHSSSLFFMANGIIEQNLSGEEYRLNAYDPFSVNTIMRSMMETFTTFHHLFIQPSSDEEKRMRFLLWQIDSFYQKKKYGITDNDTKEASALLEKNELILQAALEELKENAVFKALPSSQQNKLYNPGNQKSAWRFILKDNQIKLLQITELISHVYGLKMMKNFYKHSSIHAHSNYSAIEELERIRGKIIAREYRDAPIRLAIITTCRVIYDICIISKEANKGLKQIPSGIIKFIVVMSEITDDPEND